MNIFKRLLFPAVSNYSGVGGTTGLSGSSGQGLNNDIELHIAESVLRLSQRQLVAYQFGQPLTLEKNRGATYTATRYERLPLPYAPLSEGVAASGQAITIAQVSATAQQWGDLVRVTDVADMTIKHPLFKQAIRLISMQQPETIERNTLNQLLTATQINFAGTSKTTRFALAQTDALTTVDIGKIVGNLRTAGAPTFMGDEREDMKIEAGKYREASKDPRGAPHYVALVHPLVEQDLMQVSAISTAFAYSDVNRLYNSELGEWGGARFCRTNMMPYWTGVAQINGTAGTVGSLATGTYYVLVTASPAQTSVEQKIYQVSASISVTGPNGSISVTLPSLPGYVFNVYVGTSTTPTNLAASASGPAVGPLAGQATQLAGGQSVILTAVGVAQTPPAPVATGVTVFPTIFMGTDAYGQVLLDNVEYHYLKEADKSDPHNQTRVVTWKMMYGTIILNQLFLARVESGSNFAVGYTLPVPPATE